MSSPKEGDKVKIHYKGTLDDGTVFDLTLDKDTVELVLGSGEVLPALEKVIMELKVGETREVSIPAEDAYGNWNENLVKSISRDKIPPNQVVGSGELVYIMDSKAGVVPVVILEVWEDELKVDGNHPLAGMNLNYEVSLREIL